MSTILLVEDEPSYYEAISYLLEKEGFDVELASTGTQALEIFANASIDLILLDLMLPEQSGMDVCRHIRRNSDVPIIMVTAKDSETDIVVGLELGADDYVTKPYSTRELVARIHAALRRKSLEQSPSLATPTGILTCGNIHVDLTRYEVTVNNSIVELRLKEFELLEFLIRNKGRVVTRGQLIDRVWGSDYVGDTKTLDVHVKRLRAKIEAKPSQPEILLTVRGVGYKIRE